jgi:hypothetical protein
MLEADVSRWVSAEFQRLAEVINDYDHNLFLEWIPPEHHAELVDKSKVFRIVDDRTKTIVMYFDSLANPREILTRLWTADQAHNDPVAILDASNAAAEALRNEAIIEERLAQRDFAMFVGKNTKSRWHHNGRVRDEEFNDLGPVAKVIT